MRVMTYNIRGGLGMDGRRDTARIAEAVSAWQPDIACFQEVHRRLPWSERIDQPRILEKLLGMPFFFQANVRVPFGGYGLGIATRYPVLSQKRHRLPSAGEQRGVLELGLETSAGPLTVFCTHWGLRQDERRRQASALQDYVAAAIGPCLVCGDLNEDLEADYLQEFLRKTSLCDCGAEEKRPTYPADAPRARIDVIWASQTGLGPEARVVVPETPASDHLPVIADFPAGG